MNIPLFFMIPHCTDLEKKSCALTKNKACSRSRSFSPACFLLLLCTLFFCVPTGFAQEKAALLTYEWAKAEELQKSLEAQICRQMKTWSPAEVDKFLKSPDNRLTLARWTFIESAGAKNVSQFCKDESSRKVMMRFGADTEWLEGYLYSGPTKHAALYLRTLKEIMRKNGKKILETPVLKRIATATAAEYSRNRWVRNGYENAVARYNFFANSWETGTLNPVFDTLNYSNMRILGGWKGDNEYGNAASLLWARDNIKLTEAGYAGGDIHQLHYRLWNKAGDSVHSDEYYRPYRKMFSDNGEVSHTKMARAVGAVCGGISHYGVAGAVANGVPAITMGEPGHCAFAVLQAGKWRDNNSISWARGAHWTILEERSWAFLHLTQRIYSDEKKSEEAFRKAALARLLAKRGDVEKALALYEQALEAQPINFVVWRRYLTFAKTNAGTDLKRWERANEGVVNAFVENFPDCAATTLVKHVYPTLLPLLPGTPEKIAAFNVFLSKLDSLGPASWEFEKLWDFQSKALGGDAEKFKEAATKTLSGKKHYEKNFENWKNGIERKK